MRWNDDDRNRVCAGGARKFGHEWSRTFVRVASGKHEHGDVFIRLDQFEDFHRAIALADNRVRKRRRNALNKGNMVVEKLSSFVSRLCLQYLRYAKPTKFS